MSSRIDLINTSIKDLFILQRKPLVDARGYFERLFCVDELAEVFPCNQIAQINHTLTTTSHTVRGMHFQRPPHSEVKIVSCLQGEVFDVAVDLRSGSPTFLEWHAELLSSDNHRSLLIPKGFAHGYQALTDNCKLMYLHSVSYSPEAEDGLHPLDPKLGIDWPEPAINLSERDSNHRYIEKKFCGLSL